MLKDIDVFIDRLGPTHVGTIHRYEKRGGEAVTFEYASSWLRHGFAIDPGLPLQRGTFSPSKGLPLFGVFSDSAPDSWGRRLMQRAERRNAEHSIRAVRAISEAGYLLGVSDEARLGALRFRCSGEQPFLAEPKSGVPALVELGRLLQITERVLRDEDVGDDLDIIFAPGSSLGGARPKASILDQHGRLSIAKFPKETDDYSIERWEHIALVLAARAKITVAETSLVTVASRPVLISRRFDRAAEKRIFFASALTMLERRDGERGSYPEFVDVLSQAGSEAQRDTQELFIRLVFNILISNVDDHLRNHGFLRLDERGLQLSPAYDINPVPADIRPRVLSTNISLDDATCDIDLAIDSAEFFNISPKAARYIARQTAEVTSKWRDVAKEHGASLSEIKRMASAFEHRDFKKSLAFE